ncbi:tryptophan synthase beta subunit-like PLP-dependent enzyme [Xylariales sp. PMI_506]|nr:tryptophan synthase beta subunit-like PLP-dependent enzyme [Xylariales sp. PMI_506]
MMRPVYFNPAARSWDAPAPPGPTPAQNARAFHSQLPGYQPTRLVSLDKVAQEVGVRAVYVKDESSRFDLPAFKILGASWGTFRAITQKLGLSPDTELSTVRDALIAQPFPLFAATDGNHGRAVARMGKLLGVPVEVYVPSDLHPATIVLIESEDAKVVATARCYDTAIEEAYEAAQMKGGILIQDTAFGSYQEIPQWIVDGYQTMMIEAEEQLPSGLVPDLVVAPVGVGSFAQAVVQHFKRSGSETRVLTVEPDTAACLWKSLQRGESLTEFTTGTIMAGMNCGTVSATAWPLLQSGVDASLTISDYEAHSATLDLHDLGVQAGPCGAATLGALRRLNTSDKAQLGLSQDSVVVLLCTEGSRQYEIPRSVSADDAVTLTLTLVQINSANPSLSSIPAPGEMAVAQYIRAWLEHRNIESHWVEPRKGRPSVVGVVRGSGGGKSLMFNGHIDTVTLVGYEGDPLSGKIENGKLYGRGAIDMKSGIAAAMAALAKVQQMGLAGDVIFTGVADEEAHSCGTEDILAAGWRADGAIVNEPTDLDIIYDHKGFAWFEVDIHGLAAHGSLADLGVDAIVKAGYFLVELDRYSQNLKNSPLKSPAGLPTVHASIIEGGEESSSYPALCTVTLERRTVNGETAETVRSEIQGLLDKLSKEVPDFHADLRVGLSRPPSSIPLDHPFNVLVGEVVAKELGREATFRGLPFWCDAALLTAEGIPSLLLGPYGEGLHAKTEWVDTASITSLTSCLVSVAAQFCQ